MMSRDIVAILDAGSQYGKVIDRKVREINIETEILPINTSYDILKSYKAIIISGGPQSVCNDNSPKIDKRILDEGIPILGICYGMQMLAYFNNGVVEKLERRHDGQFTISVDVESKLYTNLSEHQKVLLTHGDTVTSIGEPWKVSGKLDDVIVSIENPEKKQYGVQFHPEVDLTPNGKKILENFLVNIAGIEKKYTLLNRKQRAIEYIQSTVGDKKILVLVSGGVDSTVCAALCKEAVGSNNVFAIHIDNGFMRKNESEKVFKALKDINLDIKVINGSSDFYNGTTTLKKDNKETFIGPLSKTINPEEKRKIIGDTFIRIAQKEVNNMGISFNDIYLAQGTLRPDLIESASLLISQNADVIKTHHNDTELVREFRKLGHIIEPLSDYHKDEVRELGRDLGLPDSIVSRHPFPGPGLSIRIICSEKADIDDSFTLTNDILSNISSDNISKLTLEKIDKAELMKLSKLFKEENIFSHLLPIKTVGVQGDGRSYKYLCALYSESNKKLNWEKLSLISQIIPKIFHNINRVVYVFGEPMKNPITTTTPTYLSEDNIHLLQNADDIVNTTIMNHKLIQKISQIPVILVPIGFEKPGTHSIAIRTIITNDFMTGSVAIPSVDYDESILYEMIDKIKALDGITRVLYDLTPKPPATTEWE